jgi:hypothetical protein
MKINFEDYDFSEFIIKEGIFCGISAKLIIPNHIGTKFTQKNKIFRSSIWDFDGNLLSGGFFKFVNFGENPENFPVPLSINNCTFVEKIDGSCAILDYINNQLSMRTRGTLSYLTMGNASDFEYCLAKYPMVVEWLKANPQYTLLCEITTPNLKIILDYGPEPEFWLVGAVNKNDYSLMPQSELEKLGMALNLKRPQSFSFTSIPELLDNVSTWTDKEGVCLYSNNSQEIHKIKASVYLKLHRFKESATLENTLELFLDYKRPTYQEFEKQLQTQFDFECWNMVRGFASNICDAGREVQQIAAGMQKYVDETLKPLSARKDQAIKVTAAYGPTNRSAMVFTLLDSKPLSNDQIRKLFWQVLKK